MVRRRRFGKGEPLAPTVLDTWHPVLDANGKTVTSDRGRDGACIAERKYHFTAAYQPDDR
jgi:hypothetical protein